MYQVKVHCVQGYNNYGTMVLSTVNNNSIGLVSNDTLPLARGSQYHMYHTSLEYDSLCCNQSYIIGTWHAHASHASIYPPPAIFAIGRLSPIINPASCR